MSTIITEAKVVLKSGHDRHHSSAFRDSGGIAVGNEYVLTVPGHPTKRTWRVEKIVEVLEESDKP